MKKKILFRVEANELIGIGHVTRCLHFASYFQDYEIYFFFKENSLIKDFISSFNYNAIELERDISLNEELEILKKYHSNLIILDIRGEDDNYYKTYSGEFKRVLRFDDTNSAINIYSDFYLNYNLYSKNIKFNVLNDKCELLLGPKYYILNPSFAKYEKYRKNIRDPTENILITMGGSDPHKLTLKIIETLVKEPNLHLNVVLGKLYSNIDKIDSLKNKHNSKISLFQDIQNMPEMMASNDLIITTGGNTSFEAAFMGTPGILINQNELQAQNSLSYHEEGVFLDLGLGKELLEKDLRDSVKKLLTSKSLREKMNQNCKNLQISQEVRTIINKIIT